jgi:hypothetical protein
MKPENLSHEFIGALADVLNCAPITVKRWMADKQPIITSEPARAVFERFGYTWQNGEVVRPKVIAD